MLSLYLSGEKHGWSRKFWRPKSFLHPMVGVLVPVDQRRTRRHTGSFTRCGGSISDWKLWGYRARVFGTASFFGESRRNGTPVANQSHPSSSVCAGRTGTYSAIGAAEAHAYGGNTAA